MNAVNLAILFVILFIYCGITPKSEVTVRIQKN